MTVAEFVEKVFVPEHVTMKNLSGRTQCWVILKQMLAHKKWTASRWGSQTRAKA
jgi:hypothetical protein